MIPTYAVIPTANRPDVCLDAVNSIRDQVNEILVIDSGTDRPMPAGETYFLLQWNMEPFNLSKAWNMGITMARIWAGDRAEWNVAIINDDAIVPPGWVEAVSSTMRREDCAAGCSDAPFHLDMRPSYPIIHRHPGPVDLRTRMTGWAFMLAGEKGVTADERLVWWFGDDDLDWQSRQAGGTIRIPGYPVENRFPNGQHTAEREEQAGRDRATFESIWGGMTPW